MSPKQLSPAAVLAGSEEDKRFREHLARYRAESNESQVSIICPKAISAAMLLSDTIRSQTDPAHSAFTSRYNHDVLDSQATPDTDFDTSRNRNSYCTVDGRSSLTSTNHSHSSARFVSSHERAPRFDTIRRRSAGAYATPDTCAPQMCAQNFAESSEHLESIMTNQHHSCYCQSNIAYQGLHIMNRDPAERPRRTRSRAIAIRRKPERSEGSESDSSDEHMYDWATWRMYNRIIDHRQRHPVKEKYYRNNESPSCGQTFLLSPEDAAQPTSAHHCLTHPLHNPLPFPDEEGRMDGEVFELDF